MKTICVSCILYTVSTTNAENNRYTEIFILWLSKLIKIRALTPNDSLHITIDNTTFEYCKKNYACFNHLLRFIPNLHIHIEEQPSTILEGMMWKFIPRSYTQDVFLYLDIDIYVLKPLHCITDQMEDNKIYVMQEGNLTESNYNAAFSEEMRSKFTAYDPGFSSGKFAITSITIRNIIFEEIRKICDYSSNYYCLDQTFFNCIMYAIRSGGYLDMNILKMPLISYNGQEYSNNTVLYDCAGDPANGKMHIMKFIDLIGLESIGIL